MILSLSPKVGSQQWSLRDRFLRRQLVDSGESQDQLRQGRGGGHCVRQV